MTGITGMTGAFWPSVMGHDWYDWYDCCVGLLFCLE